MPNAHGGDHGTSTSSDVEPSNPRPLSAPLLTPSEGGVERDRGPAGLPPPTARGSGRPVHLSDRRWAATRDLRTATTASEPGFAAQSTSSRREPCLLKQPAVQAVVLP